MNPRATVAAVSALVAVALVGFFVVIRPGSTGTADEVDRQQIDPEKVVQGKDPMPVVEPATRPDAAPATDDAPAGEAVAMELPDRPDEPIDPMSHYPLSKQGMEGAFEEMQIEFDACRAERGVQVPDNIEVKLTVRRESPPAEEYGIEEGEIWGMVKNVEVVGGNTAAMKPFTDCVQDNLYDLLFTPPEADATITWPMSFTK